MSLAQIWEHIVDLGTILFITLAFITSLILLARIVARKKSSNKLSYRVRLEVFLVYTRLAEVIEITQVVLSLLSVVLYIVGTYLHHGTTGAIVYSWLDFIFCVFFTLYWVLDLYLAKNRLQQLFSFFSFVDLLSILPIYDNIIRGRFFDELDTYQFLRMLRVLRVLRLNRIIHLFKNDVTQYLFKTIISIFTFIFLVAGFYMNIEVNSITNEPLKFHETIYFLVVTMATVGYGDLHPTTAAGMITITLAICIGAIIVIPFYVSKFLEKINAYSPYKRSLTNIQNHIIILGDIWPTSLLEFLLEFYHERHGTSKKEVVILNPNLPSEKVKAILAHPFYKNRLVYLQGDAIEEEDLLRARLHYCDACFVFPPRWHKGDAKTLLTLIQLMNMRRSLVVFPQLINPDSKTRMPPNVRNNFLCLEDFRSALLAQNCLCPGFSTLLLNLFTSRQILKQPGERWLVEYNYGSTHNVLRIPIPPSVQGRTYFEVLETMYTYNYALVIGIEEAVQSGSGGPAKKPIVRIYPPLSTVLNVNMSLIVIGHVGLAAGEKGKTILSAQSITKSGYSGMLDDDEVDDEEIEIVTAAQKMYRRLFAPDSILLQADEDNFASQDLFIPLSASRAPSTNEVEITMAKHDAEKGVEMDGVGLTRWRGHNTTLDTNPHRPRLRFSSSLHDIPTSSSSSNLLKSNSLPTVPEDVESPPPDTPSPSLASPATTPPPSPPPSHPHTPIPLPISAPLPPLPAADRPPRDETIQKLCETEFGGNWKALLQATAETITSQKKVKDPKFKDIVGEIWSILDTKEVPVGSVDIRKQFQDHVVILGSTARGSELLLDFLRFSSLGDAGILIMSKDEPPDRMKELADPRITFIHGDPTDRLDLDKCFIEVASKIIILSNPYFSDDDREGADAATIMAHLDVHKLAPNAQIFTELVHEPNLKFFRKDQVLGVHPAKKKRLKTKKEKEHYEAQEYFIIPEFASGQVCTLSTLDSLICQIYYEEHIVGVAKGLVYGVNSVLVARGGLRCRHLPVGEDFHGREHHELYAALLARDALPLALYRCTQMTGAPLPFVFTCPPPNTILHELDNVLVLERDD
eukprot:Phypoly_transcript_01338.p1 GENE.Phypoly_transcript_01338~~Phypoly_transcript_01338.p1  ORF type:complete len:1085 (+),score=170.19 Phypoly_transcript_01338:113-3367(+)